PGRRRGGTRTGGTHRAPGDDPGGLERVTGGEPTDDRDRQQRGNPGVDMGELACGEPALHALVQMPPQPAPKVYQVSELNYSVLGDHTEPEVVMGESSWVWQRSGVSIGGTTYAHGVTVHSKSSVTIQLNKQCTRYEAMVGVDDMMMGLGAVRFSVFNGDGTRLWQSPVMNGGDPAVPVRVGITGQKSIRLVVERARNGGGVTLADWADSRISCQ
ncbi:hypothetical protein EAO76_11925, partial [Streptomyces sp. sk2.1]